MSFEDTNAALEELFRSVALTQSDIDKVDILSLPPSNKPTVSKKTRDTRMVKYIDLSMYKTKEEKMIHILAKVVEVFTIETVNKLKDSGKISVEYSRPYKNSLGGPVILVHDFDMKTRSRFGEINGKFPIAGLIEEIQKVEE